MRNFFAHLLSKTCRNQTNETESRQNRIEPLSKQLRAVYEPFTRDNVLLPLSNVCRFITSLALFLCLGVGQMWGAVYKTYSLSDLTQSSLTYEVTGLSSNDQKLNKGERKVEVPCASASGTLYLSGTGANANRYASIWGSNGTVVDATRKIAMTSGYGSGISFTSADILTDGGKYYIIFSNVDDADYKINAFKYTLSAACGGGGCVVPTSVSVDATNANGWRYSIGETIDLTCTATGGTGTKTYQWQKYIGSSWTDIDGATNARFQKTNCTSSDGGSYRCVVSTGATCSLASDGYFIRVFTLNGNYSGSGFTENAIVWTGANTGVATVNLNASSKYEFKVYDNDGKIFGNGENNYIIQPVSWNCGTGNSNCNLYTGPAGNYTFTIDISHAQDGSPYVNVQVGYPSVSHPDAGYMYITKWWGTCYVHYWEGTNNALSTWGSDPALNSDRYVEICGTNYWYFPVIATYNKFIAKDAAGDPSNTTGDQVSTDHGGKYITHDGSWGWHDFSTYTITYAANGGSGTMASNTGICPNGSQTLTSNSFTRNGYSFSGWNTVSGGGGTSYANGATISSINANIELFAQWTCVTPTFSTNLSTSTVNYNQGASASALTVAATAAGGTVTYQWYSNDENNTTTPTTLTGQTSASYTPSTSSVGTTYYYCVATNSTAGCSTTVTSNITPVTVAEAATLTALVSGTLYTPGDMLPTGSTISGSSTYAEGLSDNTKFFIVGSASSTSEAAGVPEIKTNSKVTYDGIDFTEFAYFKGAANKSGNTPTSRAIKFIIPGAGNLIVYGNNTIKLYKEGTDATSDVSFTSGKSTNAVTADTYYLYAANTSRNIVGVKFEAAVACTAAPTVTAGSNSSVGSTTATVSCASGISSLGTGGCTITSYGFVIGTSANPEIGGSGVTQHEVGTSYTTTGTSFSKDLTGLTASTTYYVRPYATNGYGTGYGTQTSFTTSAPEPEALVHWTMNVATDGAWGTTATSTTDGTNISSISTSHDEGDNKGKSSATAKTAMADAEVTTAAEPTKSAKFTFTIASSKKVEPERVTCEVFNVSSGNRTYKAQISDSNGHVYNSTNTVAVSTEATLTPATFTFASDLVLTGNVTVKVYAWKTSGSPTDFRMGPDVKLYGEVQNAADYTVTHTLSNVTKSAGATSVKEGNKYTATYAASSGYTLPSTITVTIGGSPATAGTDYTWTQGTGVVTIPGNKVTGNIVITVTGVAIVHHDVDFTLTHVEYSSGDDEGTDAATEGTEFSTVFVGSTGYNLPSTITVTIDGDPATSGTDYTWNQGTGTLTIPGAKITGDITVSITGEEIPATKDIYYGHVKITDGALVREIPSGATQFFTNIGGTIANNTEISLSSTPSTTGMYYNSNNLTDTELSKSSNWSTSSGSNRYIRGLKFANGTTYTLALGTKVASAITFYGWCGSSSKTMTVGGEEFTSSSTKNTFAKHEFIKTGGFTGNVSITEDGDFYGILVITIQTATPCTTPLIPALSNQSLCEGTDIAEWNATVTNAAAIEAAGESIAYSWKKKGNDTELANTATFDLGSSATESQAGTYVVTVTVSKAGKASSSAYREVELSVTEETEVTNITADKATVYAGNSVTLTATANTTVTWQWYTCTNAAGDGESSIGGATSASYTITSAPAAGTHYYKVKATSSCGMASMVYALTVSAPSECENYFWFVYAADATTNGVVNNRDNFFGSSPKTGSSNSSTYKFTLDGTEYTATRNTGDNTFSISFTVPEGSTATLALNCKGSSSKPIYLIPTSGDPVLITDNSSNAAHVVENIAAGTYKVGAKTDASASWTLAGMAVQVCTASTCTDATPTITAANTTVCVGSELSISSTGYETGATFKWQKLNSSTSTWDNISGATSATYTVATAAAEHAGSYRLVATNECARTSNTVTIAVPSAPVFGAVPSSVSIMQTEALSISTVEASDATGYKWYKSADATFNAGSDTEIGTTKNLIKAYNDEAVASPSYYLFCVATNSCGSTTSSAIVVNVTTYVEEDCATRGNEGEAEFEFDNGGCSQASYSSTPVWSTGGSNSKILTYTAPTGKYFKTAKVTIASSSENEASYNWSTDGGSSYTSVKLDISTTLTERTINLAAHGNVDKFQIGRNLGGTGSSSGNLYVSKICFEYTESCTATTVTVSPTSKTYTIDDSWTAPTITLTAAAVAAGGTLTYSSSNEDIATVDDDGTVTFNDKAGSVKITASYAGDATYCASEGSYTITVSCSDEAPKVVPASGTNMSGCNTSVTLNAKMQNGTSDFANGTYQWFRNGEEISGATSASYTAVQAGVYTVERTGTGGCTNLSSNHVTITSETVEPEVKHLVPFQYYHVDKTYSNFMKMRHLFTVKGSAAYGETGKRFKLEMSRNGAAATDVTTSSAIEVWQSADHTVDTVMIDLNKLASKYAEGDELVYTCKAIDCSSNVSETYKDNITMHVIGSTPTLALICSGSDKAAGTRKTDELTVGGDFLTGYNKADLCKQTGNTSFDANTEWGLYTELKTEYIVTPVNGYAEFNKLNYEPFDILFLTDYPKASKDFNKKTGDGPAATILDDMAELCDYRPLFSFKTHMVQKQPSKWAAKGFTTSPVVPKKTDGRLNLNIVCYAHPMFESIKTGADVYDDVGNTSAPLVYKMLSDVGYENSKGMQGFEIAAAENFVTIGLIHDTAFIDVNTPETGQATWTTNSKDRMLVTAAERQTNIEARMILFSLNAGAHSKLTDKGELVVLKCLEYLLDVNPLHVADCSFTFDNGASNERDADWYSSNCNTCTGTKGDGKWSTQANWGPDYRLLPGEHTSVRIKAPVEVDMTHALVMEARLIENGHITIPAGKALEVKSTIRRMDGTEISPTDNSDITIGSSASGNGTLIFNNDKGDSKATVHMYSKAQNLEDGEHCTWQYVGMPFQPITDARSNYYNAWLYSWNPTNGWEVVHNGGPVYPWKGYCITHPTLGVVYDMTGTLTETGTIEIEVPANSFQVIGNSWTAPIQIANFADADFGELTRSVYFFNTGTDSTGTGSVTVSATGDARWAPGTYVSVPIHSAPYTGDAVINSMQGFYVVNTTGSATTLSLDYEKVVRPQSGQSLVQGPMHAPRRFAASSEPSVLKIMASGSHYDDKLVVLEREDFTTGTDDGWDGEKWDGSTISPCIWSVNSEGGVEAVTATPSMDGTIIGFRAGEDSEYTFHFDYNGEEDLYLLDVDTKIYTPIVTGGAYHFTCADKGEYNRFILTRKAPQIATGVEDVQGNEGARAKKLLIENKMYILLNGMLYDATGKVVK